MPVGISHVVISLLGATGSHSDCDGACVAAWADCSDSHRCCKGARCVTRNDYSAQCLPQGTAPPPTWEGATLSCEGPPAPDVLLTRSMCNDHCVPHYRSCNGNHNCCGGSRCVQIDDQHAKCWPDWRDAEDSWDGSVLNCDSELSSELPPEAASGPKEPERAVEVDCGGACVRHYGSCAKHHNCCGGSRCIRISDHHAQCWPDWRAVRPHWNGSVLTCPNSSQSSDDPQPRAAAPPPYHAPPVAPPSIEPALSQPPAVEPSPAEPSHTGLHDSAVERPPPREPCGCGFRAPCQGATTIVWLRELTCEGRTWRTSRSGTAACSDYCTDCDARRRAAYEAFLDGWVNVPVRNDGCLAELEATSDMFERFYHGKTDTELIKVKPDVQHRQVRIPDALSFSGNSSDMCVPCGWLGLPSCATHPPCDCNRSSLVVQDGRCQMS